MNRYPLISLLLHLLSEVEMMVATVMKVARTQNHRRTVTMQAMVVVNEETQSFASFVTKICAVIGGIYTVIGLVDNTIYHTGSALKKHL